MRIFFTTPFSGKRDFQPFIDEVIKILKKGRTTIISPENPELYAKAIHEYEASGLQFSKAHYAFITHGIAEADMVIIEASQESLRIGHEITLALIYGKPTLILSQNRNFANYILHELLTGAQYANKQELRRIVEQFLESGASHLQGSTPITQSVEAAVDSLRLATFATMRQHALRDNGEFGRLAELAESNPDIAHKQVYEVFGNLPVGKPWSAFASIYNEDTPDFIFSGALQFIDSIFKVGGVKKSDLIVDVYTHGGTIARQLLQMGYKKHLAVNEHREILARTYQLCADKPAIQIMEAKTEALKLLQPAKAMVWIDYTSNLTLVEKELQAQLQSLIDNLEPEGTLVFDLRTILGWKTYFFTEKVATLATPNFQRISANTLDPQARLIHFDRFIRVKEPDGLWGEWRREQMTDRLWSIDEIKAIIARVKGARLDALYSDNFVKLDLKDTEETSLVYFVIKKSSKT